MKELLGEFLCKQLVKEYERRTNPHKADKEKPRVVLRELLQMTYSMGVAKGRNAESKG